MHIGVVNKATKLSDGDAQTITAAVNGQVNDQFAPACFVLPAFFDPGAAGRYDQLDKLSAGFSIGQGGYAIQMKAGQPTQVLGEEYPDWRIGTKEFPAARTARRLAFG